MSIESDIAAMLTGWDARDVVLGDFTGKGVVQEMDVIDSDRTGDPVLVRRTVLRLRRSDFLDGNGELTVSRGDPLTIDGASYTLSDPRVGGYERGMGGADMDARVLHLIVRKV
jgi:hypothetical protein